MYIIYCKTAGFIRKDVFIKVSIFIRRQLQWISAFVYITTWVHWQWSIVRICIWKKGKTVFKDMVKRWINLECNGYGGPIYVEEQWTRIFTVMCRKMQNPCHFTSFQGKTGSIMKMALWHLKNPAAKTGGMFPLINIHYRSTLQTWETMSLPHSIIWHKLYFLQGKYVHTDTYYLASFILP